MNAPLTKEQFCTAIDNIKDYWNKIRDIEDILGVIFSESELVNIVDNYVDTLSLVMKDFLAEGAPFEDMSWIMYFCWEKDFGREYHDGDVTIDGKEFPLATSEELYDLLIKLYWKEN